MSLPDSLRGMAQALASPDSAAFAAAEKAARESLIERIASMPPSAVVSHNALRAFRTQHVEMMGYVDGASPGLTAGETPSPVQQPPPKASS
jgi:hypothetical protein